MHSRKAWSRQIIIGLYCMKMCESQLEEYVHVPFLPRVEAGPTGNFLASQRNGRDVVENTFDKEGQG
jgi:hypothetical protein